MVSHLLLAWSAGAIVVTLGSTPRGYQTVEVDASASVRREARPFIDTSDLLLSGFVDDGWGQTGDGSDQGSLSSIEDQHDDAAASGRDASSSVQAGLPKLVDSAPPAPSPFADKDTALRHAVKQMAAESRSGQQDHPIGYVKPVPLGPPQHYYDSASSTAPPALQRVGVTAPSTAASTTAESTTAKVMAVPSTSATAEGGKHDEGLGIVPSVILLVIVCSCSCLAGGLLAVLIGHHDGEDQATKGTEEAEGESGRRGFADDYAIRAGTRYEDVDPGADADDDTGAGGVVSSDEG
mmetsp:Transcript_54478/g.100748  ORF Transcript_54478/g.100748 Transcript_54478/m.100748 type:complete len:294 (+) Transcript_54478:73-954(+)